MTRVRASVAAGVAAGLARALLRYGDEPAGLNYRGRRVRLAGGPAAAIGATTGAFLTADQPRLRAAALVAGGVAGAVGRYDDLVAARPAEAIKGLRGHLVELRRGRITAGVVKAAGLGAAGIVAATLVHPRTPAARRVVDASLIAGTANLLNLLDLRPGRALKVGLALTAAVHGPAAVAGAAAALLRPDLAEEVMLGDCGANSLGALIGLRLVERTRPGTRLAALAAVAALTLASERVSFSAVIESAAPLRRLDRWGRR